MSASSIEDTGRNLMRKWAPTFQFGIVRYRKDKPYVALRERLGELGAEVEDLPDGTFEAEGTSVRTVLIKVEL